MKYIIYCRKSTESEDRQILSLPAQERELKALVEKEKLNVVKIFSESASAYKIGRPLFNKMIQMLREKKADAILVWTYNRLARNSLDGGMIIYLLDEGLIKEIKTPTGTIDGSGNGKFMLQLEFAMSKKSSDDNSEAVKRGNREKILKGLALKKHLGYKFVTNEETNERILVPDKERFKLLQKSFRLIIDGHSVNDTLTKLNDEWGFRTPKTKKLGNKPLALGSLYKILKSEFYCGWLYTARKERVKGKHIALITEAEFEKLQIIIGNHRRSRSKTLNLPYGGQIRCGECGCAVCLQEKYQCICSECKKKFASKNRDYCPFCQTKITDMKLPKHLHYIYASCIKKKKIKCHQHSINLENLEKQIKKILDSIELSPRIEQWLIKQINKKNQEKIVIFLQADQNLNKELVYIEKQITELLKKYTAPSNSNYEEIEPDEYKELKKNLKEQKKQIIERIGDNQAQKDQHHKFIESTFNFAATARQSFETATYKEKSLIIHQLGSNLILKDGNITIQSPYPWFYIQKAKQKLDSLKEQGLETK